MTRLRLPGRADTACSKARNLDTVVYNPSKSVLRSDGWVRRVQRILELRGGMWRKDIFVEGHVFHVFAEVVASAYVPLTPVMFCLLLPPISAAMPVPFCSLVFLCASPRVRGSSYSFPPVCWMLEGLVRVEPQGQPGKMQELPCRRPCIHGSILWFEISILLFLTWRNNHFFWATVARYSSSRVDIHDRVHRSTVSNKRDPLPLPFLLAWFTCVVSTTDGAIYQPPDIRCLVHSVFRRPDGARRPTPGLRGGRCCRQQLVRQSLLGHVFSVA